MSRVDYDGAPGADDDGPRFQYVALAFSPPEGPAESRALPDGSETVGANILSLIPESEHSRWREWLGSVPWERLKRAGRVVVAREAATELSIHNEVDLRLRARVDRSWSAFLLSGAATESDSAAWFLHGEAAGDRSGSPLRSLKTVGQIDRLIRPPYRGRERYVGILAKNLMQYWSEHGSRDQSWFPRWLDACALLNQPNLPLIVGYALLAHGSAWTRRYLEFSIPEFVRVAEGVIALPRNQGGKTFVERALRLAPGLQQDEYVGMATESLLPELYQLRSDCVHGKLPFAEMQALGDKGEEHAAQLSYVAEVLARESVLTALRHPDWSVFATRDNLEQAWASGAFP